MFNQVKEMIMKKMFKIMLVAVMAASSLTASADNEGIILTQKDGQTVGFAFAQEPKMSFTATDVVIQAGDQSVGYAMDGLKITFGDVSATAVKSIEKADVKFAFSKTGMQAAGLQAGETVSVYTLNGTRVATAKVGADGKVSVNLPQKGVYVVKAGRVSYKFSK